LTRPSLLRRSRQGFEQSRLDLIGRARPREQPAGAIDHEQLRRSLDPIGARDLAVESLAVRELEPGHPFRLPRAVAARKADVHTDAEKDRAAGVLRVERLQ